MPIYKLDGKRDGRQKYRVAVSYTTADGEHKQVFRVVYGKDEAKDLESELLRKYRQTDLSERMTVEELIDEYLAAKKQEVRATTYDKSRRNLAFHITPVLGKYRLEKLNVQVLQRWKTELGEKDLALKTKQNIYKELAALLNYAVSREHMAKNPLSSLGNFRDTGEAPEGKELRYYTADQFLSYIAAARADAEATGDWRYYTFFMTAFYSGMRKGEINALRWSDIEGNILHVRRSISQKLKGDDVETLPKNKTSFRDLQMPRPLIDALRQQKQRQQSAPGFTEQMRVCGGEEPLRDTSIEKKNEAYRTAAGLPHIRIHDFRHSHASVLVNEGISIQEIARRLGHAKVEITWSTYAHLYPREEERAVAVLDEIAPDEKQEKNKNISAVRFRVRRNIRKTG